jgi:aspartate aminotransferase
MIGAMPHFVPAAPGDGGIPDPAALDDAVMAAAASDRRIGSVLVTLPDNPTGRQARPATVTAPRQVAAAHQLVISCDEIYRDLAFPGSRLTRPVRNTRPTASQTAIAPGPKRAAARQHRSHPVHQRCQDRQAGEHRRQVLLKGCHTS